MLGLLQPDIIAIEIDTKRAQYLDRWLADPPARVSAFLKKYPHSYPETVAWIVKNYVYEYRESGDYCAQSDAHIAYVDDEVKGRSWRPSSKIESLITRPLPGLWALGNMLYHKKNISDERIIPWLQARDDNMERNIRALSGRVCFVGGHGHVFAEYGNLYDRFADSDVARYSLNMVGSPNWMKRVERALPIRW